MEAANENAMLSDRVEKKKSGMKKADGASDGYWSDTTYDVLGWATLVAIGFGIAAISK